MNDGNPGLAYADIAATAAPFVSYAGIGAADQYLSPPRDLACFLDEAADALESLDTTPLFWPRMLAVIEQLRRSSNDAQWHRPLRAHRLAGLLHQEPATGWAFR